jgi:hypothetical protein
MAVLELYGKCKELGYCDCGGFLGCVDDGRVQEKPDGVELDRVVKSLERSEGKLRGQRRETICGQRTTGRPGRV